MSTTDARANKPTGDSHSYPPALAGYEHLGVDERGRAHCLDIPTDSIHVVDVRTGDRVRRVELANRDVSSGDALAVYLRIIGEDVGWTERDIRHEVSIKAWLTSTLGSA